MCSKLTSLNTNEIKKFESVSEAWWDESGPYKSLHRLNLVRTRYVKDLVSTYFDIDAKRSLPLEDIKILDIGCGGGLLTEPLHRMGANIKGIDPIDKNIEIATQHAMTMGLRIPYHVSIIEDLPADKLYQVITAMEVLEHITCPERFIKECYKRLMPGGVLILSTLNRTFKAYLQAIIGAEHLLRWLPRGTHDWSLFCKPAEIQRYLKNAGFSDIEFQGLSYIALQDKWALSETLDVNYFVKAIK